MATILIIEDDEELQTMLQHVLTRHGHDVARSLNGVDALRQVSDVKPDLIILDLMMPFASGDAVLGFVRSTDSLKQTPVLVMSAHPNAERIAMQLDANAFLPKPVDMRTLCANVDAILQSV